MKPLPALLSLALTASKTAAHMALTDPAPIAHKLNPNTGPDDIDYSYTSPLSSSGADFPCKGHLRHLDTPMGQPVTTWQPGQSVSITISGQTIHDGGSCQASLSYDDGQTFKAIYTWIGNCPSAPGDTSYPFTVPPDVPSADRVVFAWSWFNKLGNREMYMNCAVVSISGGGAGVTLDSRPSMFAANVSNGCATVDSKDVMIPDPGPDVTVSNPDAVFPVGTCQEGRGAGDAGRGNGIGGTPDLPDNGDGGGSHEKGNSWPSWFNDGHSKQMQLRELLLFQVGLVVLFWARAYF